MSFLPQFIAQEVNVAAVSLVLAAVHVVLTAAWISLLVSLTVPLAVPCRDRERLEHWTAWPAAYSLASPAARDRGARVKT
jgi:threonine/homoserine/homoserine lactone efflux protein